MLIVWDETELLEAEMEVDGLSGWYASIGHRLGKLTALRGQMCEPAINRTLANERRLLVAKEHERSSSFIADLLDYMDVCSHPEHLVMASYGVLRRRRDCADVNPKQNGEMIMKEEFRVRRLEPIMAISRVCSLSGPSIARRILSDFGEAPSGLRDVGHADHAHAE
jgi:hypothetical protein